jgi:hypothetical protein
MLVEGDRLEDAIILPTDLPLRKKVNYARDWKGRQYRMEPTRLNISTVAYRYSVDDGRTVIFERKGTADLDPTFHFATEGEFEDGGQHYGMNKYHPNDTTCADHLLIGVGSIAMADYIRYCPDKDSILSMGMYKQ